MIATIVFPLSAAREEPVTNLDETRDGEWVRGVAIHRLAIGTTRL
jgi:hypothetical protein